MLIAGLDVGEFVRELQQRAVRMTVEPNRDARAAGRRRFAAHVPVREDDPLGGPYLEHLAGGLDTIRMADQYRAAGPRVDRRAGTPPRRPFGASFVKNPNTVSRLARITTVRSRRWESAIIVPPT